MTHNNQSAWRRAKAKRLKAELLEVLGGSCQCAGCSWHEGACAVLDTRILEIDHIDGGGKDHRRRSGSISNLTYVTQLMDMAENGEVQLLCANCHRMKTVQTTGDDREEG